MRSRIRTAILSGLLLASNQSLAAADGPAPILPEVTTRVALSNTDVNRLVCPEGLKDVVFSQEKGIVVKISGGNAFVKFQALKQGEETVYSETPSEFHVVCGGEIYSLIGLPQRIPAQTIRLSSGKKQTVEKNLAIFAGLPLEKKVLTLLRQAYTDQLPESYLVRALPRRIDLFPALRLDLRREILVEGEGLAVREYLLTLKDGQSPRRLSEGEFLRSELTSRPLAVALEELLPAPGKPTRLFIVERRDEDAPAPFPPAAPEPEAVEEKPAPPEAEEEAGDAP